MNSSHTTKLQFSATVVAAFAVVSDVAVFAQEPEADSSAQVEGVVEERRLDDAALNEDPEAQRRARQQASGDDLDPDAQIKSMLFDFYASARVHGVRAFDIDTLNHTTRISDGNSRAGIRAEWEFSPGWDFLARAEAGFDVVEGLSTRAPEAGDGGLKTRLLFAGIDHDNLILVYGQNWSAYYQIAGITDRFSAYGGSASGVYNAGTVGQNTGTGRAKDVIQARIFVDDKKWTGSFKPFNLNLQYQRAQPIPRVDGEKFDYGLGASAWLETQTELGFGIAYNRSFIEDPAITSIVDAGIDGDATATAVSTRWFGGRWYVSALYSRLKNIETTNEERYFNATGVEIYGQWEFRSNWWLIGGWNSLTPDANDPDVGEYRVRYAVVGGRYSFDSFRRMAYFEYRINDGRLVDGTPTKDEITIGVRWDWGD